MIEKKKQLIQERENSIAITNLKNSLVRSCDVVDFVERFLFINNKKKFS